MIYLPKSQPAPACLEIEKMKADGNHNCGEVLERLRNDFKNKCYICEESNITSINTEHFIPHKGNRELRFDWNNLFFSCPHCNNTKSARTEFDNILNCTIEADGADTRIRYHINPFPKEKAVIAAVEDDERINNTVALLNMIYNGTTTLKKIESENLRDKLLHEIKEFQDLLFNYFDDTISDDQKEQFKNKIIRHLQSASNFTAFKRWIIRDNDGLKAAFQEYL